jgi:hypothetical protein
MENYVTQMKVCSGWTDVVDEHHSDRPTTSWTADNVERFNAPVREDRRIIVTDIADKLDISCGTAYSIIHEEFWYHVSCARWVQKLLTDEHRRAGMKTFMHFLQRYN